MYAESSAGLQAWLTCLILQGDKIPKWEVGAWLSSSSSFLFIIFIICLWTQRSSLSVTENALKGPRSIMCFLLPPAPALSSWVCWAATGKGEKTQSPGNCESWGTVSSPEWRRCPEGTFARWFNLSQSRQWIGENTSGRNNPRGVLQASGHLFRDPGPPNAFTELGAPDRPLHPARPRAKGAGTVSEPSLIPFNSEDSLH